MPKSVKALLSVAVVLSFALAAGPAALMASNDARFSEQWGLHKIGAEAAWSASRGDGVSIAFIDSGVALGHPDLSGKVVAGKDFVDGDNVPDDQHGHGTLTAGIAAANTGNGQGIAGVAPGARLLVARAFDGGGNGGSDKVAAGIHWALGQGNPRKMVLNLSFVGPNGSLLLVPDVASAISAATNQGAAVVVAAGNDGSATQYNAPSGSGILVVGASTREDACSRFSNYGSGVDILAPGGAGGRSSATDILSTYLGGGYASSSGTSLATPFVSGAMALLMSKGMSAATAADRLVSSARGPAISCRGEGSSYGFLDAAAALGVAAAPPPVASAAQPSSPQAKAAPRAARAPRSRPAGRTSAAPAAPAPAPPPPPEPPTIVLPQQEMKPPPEAAFEAALELPERTGPQSRPVSALRFMAGSLLAAVTGAFAVLRFIFRIP